MKQEDYDLLQEALKIPSRSERYEGEVTGIDTAGTTAFIKSGERIFLAFNNPKNPMKAGDKVTFKIDQLRAVEIKGEV